MRFGWIVLLLAASARGDVVTYEFSGTVQRTVNGDVLFGDLPVAIGDVISGAVSYDTDVPDSEPNPDLGIYDQSLGLSFSVNGRNFAAASHQIQVVNDGTPFGPDPIDAFIIVSTSLLMEGSPVFGVFSIALVDLTATALSDTSLPVVEFADFAAPFDFTRGDLDSFGASPGTGAVFSIERFRMVPEPRSLALLAIGAVLLRRK